MKRITYTTDRELNALRWAARVIDFGVSLTVFSAFNELTTAILMLREDKDVYRREVKHWALVADKKATMRRMNILGTMKNRDFFSIYADKVIDLAEQDITLFRISIKQTMDDNRFEKAELYSYVETARTMLDLAAEHYRSVVQTTIDDFGCNFFRHFDEFYCKDVLDAWEKMCDILYVGAKIDLNTERSKKLFDELGRKFAEGEYVDASLKEASSAYPDFFNQLIVG